MTTRRWVGLLTLVLAGLLLGWWVTRDAGGEFAAGEASPRRVRVGRGGDDARPAVRGDAVAEAASCGGPVRVLDPGGVPAEGARLQVDGRFFTTDEAGEAYWADRPCGALSIGVRWEDVEYPAAEQWVEDATVLVLELPRDHEAVLRFVSEDDEPVAVELRRTAYLRVVERLDASVWRVVAPREDAAIVGAGEDGVEYSVAVTLDGQEQAVVWPRTRRVTVLAACGGAGGDDEECGWLRCGMEECSLSLPGLYTCACPRSDAKLYAPRVGDVAIPDDAVTVRVDTRPGSGALAGEWGGPLPCTARLLRGGTRAGTDGCGAAGDIVFTDVRDGAWLLEVEGGGESARRLVTIARGSVTDVGVVLPGGEAEVPPLPAAEVLVWEDDARPEGDGGAIEEGPPEEGPPEDLAEDGAGDDTGDDDLGPGEGGDTGAPALDTGTTVFGDSALPWTGESAADEEAPADAEPPVDTGAGWADVAAGDR